MEGLKIAGKTGTSRSANSAHIHAWFAGYAPADNPKIAIIVYVEEGRGPAEAALIAHKIFSAYRDSLETTDAGKQDRQP